jgi:O-antigen biosynthesis protein
LGLEPAERNRPKQNTADLPGGDDVRLVLAFRRELSPGMTQQVPKVQRTYPATRLLLAMQPLWMRMKRVVQILGDEGIEGIWIRIRILRCAYRLDRKSLPPDHPSRKSAQAGAPSRATRQQGLRHAESSVYSYSEPQPPRGLHARLSKMAAAPVFSIIFPVHNASAGHLELALRSVMAQWYPEWQLILIEEDDSADLGAFILKEGIVDPRMRIVRLHRDTGIAGARNAGLKLAEGTFVVFLDHTGELTVDCLYELARCIAEENADFVYSDEDEISAFRDYGLPHFKPGWSPDTLMSLMYTGQIACIRRSLLEDVGGMRPELEGSEDWDLVLRVTEKTQRISHIPKVLYHRRMMSVSSVPRLVAEPYLLDASRRVRTEALARRGLSGNVEPVPEARGHFRVRYQLKGNPLISIIVPTRDNEKLLRSCIASILERTCYRRFEIIVLDNGSVAPDAVGYLTSLAAVGAASVIRHDAPFNFSELNNIGARAAAGDLLLFLNDDTEVLQGDWLERMGGFAQLSHIGAVGAKLLYPDGDLVQHAGVLNLEGGPVHAFINAHRDDVGYFMRNVLEYNWLAVTGACLMVERKKFESVGGFAETLPVAYNDIDLCFRLHDRGYFSVVVQAVNLIHKESASRGLDELQPDRRLRLRRDLARLYEKNPKYFRYDPFHNPNLLCNSTNFEFGAG